MSKLIWDKIGERNYETGVDRCVLYPLASGAYQKGVAWSGITAINENPSGAEASPLFADNIKYLNLISAEDYATTIEAYTYPDEFEACNGSLEIAPGVTVAQQERQMFGLAYRTLIGNDVDGTTHGYKIHLVYGCQASPSEKSHSTVNDSPEATTLSWEVNTTPVNVTGKKPTATLVIDSTKTDEGVMAKIEAALYGTDSEEPKLLLPDEVVALINAA